MRSAWPALQLEEIRNQQVSHAEALAMKRRAHVVIDECVTGSYHRNSLEGLPAGCVVINGMHLLPEVGEAFAHCAGVELGDQPFVHADLETLEEILQALAESDLEEVAKAGRRNRVWMEQHWDFADQWKRCWLPAVENALAGRGGGGKSPPKTLQNLRGIHQRG